MVRRDGAEVKRQRIHEIAQSILKALSQQSELFLDKTLASLEYDTGLNQLTLMHYLEVMEKNGLFVIAMDKGIIRKRGESNDQ